MSALLSMLLASVTGAAAAQPDAGSCPRILHSPAAGRYLVAARHMPDPRFRETVILLLEHNDGGSLGVIVNRDTDISLEQALPRVPALSGRKETISNGGPVAKHAVIFLFRHGEPLPESGTVMEDLQFSASSVTLEKVLALKKPAGQLRLFSGHAGWAPGQLEGELRRRDWHLMPAAVREVFPTPEPGMWERLMRCMPGTGLQVQYEPALPPLVLAP